MLKCNQSSPADTIEHITFAYLRDLHKSLKQSRNDERRAAFPLYVFQALLRSFSSLLLHMQGCFGFLQTTFDIKAPFCGKWSVSMVVTGRTRMINTPRAALDSIISLTGLAMLPSPGFRLWRLISSAFSRAWAADISLLVSHNSLVKWLIFCVTLSFPVGSGEVGRRV